MLDFCTKYLDYSTRYTKGVYVEKKGLCERVLTLWGAYYLVNSITPEMVFDYLNSRAKDQSKNAYNRDRKNLLAMWNWGRGILNLGPNPIQEIRGLPQDRKPQYVPPTEDILRIIAVATREEKVLLDCYLQTAARRSEIFRWVWADDINFENRMIRLGSRKTGDGSMQYDWLPMTDELYESLWWLWSHREFKDSPYVFVDNHPGLHYGQPYKARRKFMQSLCKRAKIKRFGFHALRKYVASVLADTHKVSAKKIQRVLRHKNVTTTERYIMHLNQDLADTMNLLSKSLT